MATSATTHSAADRPSALPGRGQRILTNPTRDQTGGDSVPPDDCDADLRTSTDGNPSD